MPGVMTTVTDSDPLARRWPLTGQQALRDALLQAWSDPGRGYHDRRHLAEVLDRLDDLVAAGEEPGRLGLRAVVLAAWFHDAVYDGERDAEERSAAWAEHALTPVLPVAEVAEVARLVRLTETHRPAADDAAGALLCDADLAVLAAEPARYADYVAGVRREYAHLDDATFAAGRRSVLAGLAAAPSLFSTPTARARWESRARANLAGELASTGD